MINYLNNPGISVAQRTKEEQDEPDTMLHETRHERGLIQAEGTPEKLPDTFRGPQRTKGRHERGGARK
jgi:hypothetical protein